MSQTLWFNGYSALAKNKALRNEERRSRDVGNTKKVQNVIVALVHLLTEVIPTALPVCKPQTSRVWALSQSPVEINDKTRKLKDSNKTYDPK